jgi:uncharacterized membrane protein YsdA (DUF1294 family)
VIDRRNRPIVVGLVAAAMALFAVFVLALSIGPYPAWLAGWSVVTFAAYAIDKGRARRGGWRIPEVVLHGLAIAGGALGGWVGLLALHHKTRHPVFPLVLAVALTVQVVIGVAIGW